MVGRGRDLGVIDVRKGEHLLGRESEGDRGDRRRERDGKSYIPRER